MAYKKYSKYTQNDYRNSLVHTYYDLNENEAETTTHKHKLTASCSVDGVSSNGSLPEVTLVFQGSPNLADYHRFTFDESGFEVNEFQGRSNDDAEFTITVSDVHLNKDDDNGVKQLFGQAYTEKNVAKRGAFSIESRFTGGDMPLVIKQTIGAFQGKEKYEHDEETRTFTLHYVGVSGSSFAPKIAPFKITFAGTETWAKSFTVTHSYYLKSSKETITAHIGAPITADDLGDLAIFSDSARSQILRNNYAWPEDEGRPISHTGVNYRSVAVDDLYEKIPTSSSFVVSTALSKKDGDGNTPLLTYPTKVVGLAADPFSAFAPSNTGFEVGDTINLLEIAANVTSWQGAKIAYADGYLANLSDIELDGDITAVLSIDIDGVHKTISRSLTFGPLTEYANPTITFTIPTKYLGTLTHTYQIHVASVLARSLSISGQKTDFKYGETYSYGSGAVAHLYDNSGNEIEIEDNSVSALLADGTIISDYKISSNEAFTDPNETTIRTELSNGNAHEYKVNISYCSDFALSLTNLGNLYVDSGVSTSLDTLISDVYAKYDYHENTSASSSTAQVTVESKNITKSMSSISATNDMDNVEISFSYVPSECPLQRLSAKARFNVIVNRFVKLVTFHQADGNTYFAGRSNKFVLPSDLAIKKVYNNPTKPNVALEGSDFSSVEYRTTEGTSGSALVPGTSVISPDTKTIYVTYKQEDGTVLQGSYSIAGDYKPDNVSRFTLGESFEMLLGTKFSTYKNNGKLKLIAYYASGHVSDLTNNLFTDYRFVQKLDNGSYANEKVIMNANEKMYVEHNGNYYEVGYEKGVSITYRVPEGTISVSNYKSSYVDGVDVVDFRNAVVEITYKNADSSTAVQATLDSGNVATASTYSLSCDGITSFDGSEAFNVGGGATKTDKTITIKALNRFDKSEIATTITATVIGINGLTIDSLRVRNAKTEYKIGETFLNGTDNTLLDIYHSSSTTPITVYLKDVPAIVATDPAQGTEFMRSNDSMTVTVRLLSNSARYTTYVAKVVPSNASSTTIVRNIVAVLMPMGTVCKAKEISGKSHWYKDANGVTVCYGYYILVDSAYTEINAHGERVLKNAYSFSNIEIYGYLEGCFNSAVNARVILFDDYVPPIQGESNISVKYPCYVKGNADKIDKCRILKLFGNANAKNRLFVSGNPDFKNCDWHSGAVNEYIQQGEAMDANGDFTYFGDMDYCFYGQTDNTVMGYDHVATDKMVVLKSKSKIEPTNYFRTSTIMSAIDSGGNSVYGVDGSSLYQESFPLATGNIGVGAMNMNSIANLNGDTVYLSSENTICGLNIAGQVGDSQRISYSRSRYIDPELKQLDLREAVVWTDNSNLFLFANDCSYLTNYETYDEETGQYEWFKINVKGVRCAIEINGEIHFGCEDGSLYKLDKSIYYDCDKIFIEAGGALYTTLEALFGDNKIVYSQKINQQLDESAKYTFSMKPTTLQKSLFRKVANMSNARQSGVDLLIDYERNSLKIVALDSNGETDYDRYQVLLEELAYAGKFYLNYADGDSAIRCAIGSDLAEYYRAYYVKPTDDEAGEYQLYDADGNLVELAYRATSGDDTSLVGNLISASLCRVLDEEYDVGNLDKKDCSFKLYENGRELDIVRYGTQGLSVQTFVSELHKHTPVKAYFIAAPAVLGSLGHRKTIWSWTLSAFREQNDLQVCQATNDEKLEDMKALLFADSVPSGMDFKHFSFEAIDFGKSNVPRKYTYFRPISVPFISFGFKSDKASNSILTAATIVYTVPLLGRGSK